MEPSNPGESIVDRVTEYIKSQPNYIPSRKAELARGVLAVVAVDASVDETPKVDIYFDIGRYDLREPASFGKPGSGQEPFEGDIENFGLGVFNHTKLPIGEENLDGVLEYAIRVLDPKNVIDTFYKEPPKRWDRYTDALR